MYIYIKTEKHFDRSIEVAARRPAGCLTIPGPTESGHVLGAIAHGFGFQATSCFPGYDIWDICLPYRL